MTTPVCRFVVSACLAGEFCRYDGGSNACAAVQELVRRGEAVTACPEGLACLPVPRPPCEIREGRVLSQDGRDLTEDFLRGPAWPWRRPAGTAVRRPSSNGVRPPAVWGRSMTARSAVPFVPVTGCGHACCARPGSPCIPRNICPKISRPAKGRCRRCPSSLRTGFCFGALRLVFLLSIR